MFGERGRSMMSGEFTYMSPIYSATPGFCPRPIAWGSYVSIPDVQFLLCNYHEMTDELLDLHSFPTKTSELHHEGRSPNGKCGFSCTTYHGNTPLNHGWADTWEDHFTTKKSLLVDMKHNAQGLTRRPCALRHHFRQFYTTSNASTRKNGSQY